MFNQFNPPHFDSCLKPWSPFCIQWIKVRDDCLICWYWWHFFLPSLIIIILSFSEMFIKLQEIYWTCSFIFSKSGLRYAMSGRWSAVSGFVSHRLNISRLFYNDFIFNTMVVVTPLCWKVNIPYIVFPLLYLLTEYVKRLHYGIS